MSNAGSAGGANSALLSFTQLYSALLSFTQLYSALLSFTQLYTLVAQEALQQNLAMACAAALLLLPQRFLEPRLYATIAGSFTQLYSALPAASLSRYVGSVD